ncbi:MAG: hypothetical protein WCE43_13250 [Burkholderiales bacterium]
MRTTTKCITGLFLATAAMISAPAAIAGSYDAYEELSGTHAGKTQLTAEGVRGGEGMKGESGKAGSKPSLPNIDQAFEDLSGTHPAAATEKAGMKGSSGQAGESGKAGKMAVEWTAFDINGDVQGGCSKYLRCSN